MSNDACANLMACLFAEFLNANFIFHVRTPGDDIESEIVMSPAFASNQSDCKQIFYSRIIIEWFLLIFAWEISRLVGESWFFAPTELSRSLDVQFILILWMGLPSVHFRSKMPTIPSYAQHFPQCREKCYGHVNVFHSWKLICKDWIEKNLFSSYSAKVPTFEIWNFWTIMKICVFI